MSNQPHNTPLNVDDELTLILNYYEVESFSDVKREINNLILVDRKKQIEAMTKRLNDLWATIMIDEVGSEKAFAYREAIESQLKESK